MHVVTLSSRTHTGGGEPFDDRALLRTARKSACLPATAAEQRRSGGASVKIWDIRDVNSQKRASTQAVDRECPEQGSAHVLRHRGARTWSCRDGRPRPVDGGVRRAPLRPGGRPWRRALRLPGRQRVDLPQGAARSGAADPAAHGRHRDLAVRAGPGGAGVLLGERGGRGAVRQRAADPLPAQHPCDTPGQDPPRRGAPRGSPGRGSARRGTGARRSPHAVGHGGPLSA